MDDLSALGLLAGTLTSIAAIPQVVKSLRSGQLRDISIWQPFLLAIGIALWLIYGMLIDNFPLVVANIIPLLCNCLLVVMKLKSEKTGLCPNASLQKQRKEIP